MSELRPWALGPFELIVHAEMHQRDGEDESYSTKRCPISTG